MITNMLIGLYFVIAFIFHIGMFAEWKKDTDPEMAEFSPTFVQICLVGAAITWPLLIIVALFKMLKEK